jgi:transposase
VVSVSHLAPIHLGLDVHKDTISVGVLRPDQQVPDVDRIAHDEASVRRLLARFPDRARLRACYEAGPTGFELARLLHRMDVRCEVIAPSLIPRAPGDKARDRPAGLPAAGPVAPRRRAGRHPHPHRRGGGGAGPVPHPRRHGRRPHQGAQSAREVSAAPRAGVAGRVDPDPRLAGVAAVPAVRPASDDADVRALPGGGGGPQPGLGRGGGRPGRLVWAAAVRLAGRPAGRLPRHHAAGRADVGRRGRRLAPVHPRQPVHGVLRAGAKRILQRRNRVHRGRLTKAGNAHLRAQLVESAWSYQHRPSVGREIARRQQGLDPAVIARAWAAQQRLCARFRTLAARKHTKSIVAAAIARELAGFLWAEMTAA